MNSNNLLLKRKLKDLSAVEVVDYLTKISAKNAIKLPESDILVEIALDVIDSHGYQDEDFIKYAFRNWQNGFFKSIRRPQTLNAHFIGEVLREFQDFKSTGGKGEGVKVEKKEYRMPELTPQDQKEFDLVCWREAFDDFCLAFRGNQKVTLLTRRLWVAGNLAAKYRVILPEHSPEWLDRLKVKERGSMTMDMVKESSRHRGLDGYREDHTVSEQAAAVCTYFEGFRDCPRLIN